jgi:DNA photolyase
MWFGCRSLSSAAATNITTAVNQGKRRIVIYWFRLGDLRLLDNQALTRACLLAKGTKSEPIAGALLPIFCFDDQIFGARAVSAWGNLKCGPKRAQFVIDSVADLRQSLHTHLQAPLLVASGEPARMVDQILAQLKSYNENETTDVQIVCQDETAPEEREAVDSVSNVLRQHIANGGLDAESSLTAVWGSFLHAGKGMPYPNTRAGMSDLFSRFKSDVQKKYKLPQAVLPIPQNIPTQLPQILLNSSMATYMPTLQDLGYTPDQIAHAEHSDARGVLDFVGGETAALARVKHCPPMRFAGLLRYSQRLDWGVVFFQIESLARARVRVTPHRGLGSQALREHAPPAQGHVYLYRLLGPSRLLPLLCGQARQPHLLPPRTPASKAALEEQDQSHAHGIGNRNGDAAV